MVSRISMKDIKKVEKTVNSYLKNIRLEVNMYYGDIISIRVYGKDGTELGTLISSTRKREIYEILSIIAYILRLEYRY
jgi:ribosomal 30S subunit maturation factor RimM